MTRSDDLTPAERYAAQYVAEIGGMAEPRYVVSPDALSAAACFVAREYGFGYRIGLVGTIGARHGVLEVSAPDGSRFRLVSDAYGNVARVAERAPEAADMGFSDGLGG